MGLDDTAAAGQQARYKGPDAIDRPAPRTFDSKTGAERWLTHFRREIRAF